jgi:rhodanese-related sulfurtransferase
MSLPCTFNEFSLFFNKIINVFQGGKVMEYEDEIIPAQFLLWLEGRIEGEKGTVIDVREDWEWDYYHLEGIEWMPMQSIPARVQELPKDGPIYVLCAHGIRSASVCDYLHRVGYANAVNVIGGMAAVSALKGFRYD